MGQTPTPGARFVLRFLRDESGSMVVFTLFLLLIGLVVAGMSVDIVRFEGERSRLQATADRAVLAAADLQQTAEPAAVTRDYFDKEGLGDRLQDVKVNQHRVGACAVSRVPSLFMGMVGVPEMSIPVCAAAEESVTDIEISLVLDVSYSMQYELRSPAHATGRIAKLRTAASQFIQTVLANDAQLRITINIVPFNGQVNLGATLFNRFVSTYPGRIVGRHGASNSFCLDLPSSAYAQIGLGTGSGDIPQAGHFDAVGTASTSSSYQSPQSPMVASKPPRDGDTATLAPTCRTSPENMVVIGGQDIAALQARVQGLEAGGYTSINLGMKYGLMFLDPASQTLLNGLLPAGRPYAWGRDNTMKIIVLLTDGENMASPYLEPSYRTGDSPIYYNASSGTYAYQDGTQFWDPAQGKLVSSFTGTRLSWPQLFEKVRLSWIGQQLYTRRCGSITTVGCFISASDFINAVTGQSVAATMDSQLAQTCALARTEGVIVFGIAFDAPANGKTAIRNCVNPGSMQSNGRYYEASNDTIEAIFGSIALQINALTLRR